MKTKSYQRFIGRIADYQSDLELANVLIRRFMSRPNTQSTIAVDLGAVPATHIKLNARTNNANSRKIVGLHLKKTLYASFIKDLYEDFGEFVRNTLEMAALAGLDPSRFVGDSKVDMKVGELLATGSWEALIAHISDELFRSMENERSTTKLIEKFDRKLGLGLSKPMVADAMPYLDARHIIVHRDGVADQPYKDAYQAVMLTDGDRIKLDFPFVNNARAKVCDLAKHMDDQAMAMNLCRPQDLVN